jgi:hypothetical protein
MVNSMELIGTTEYLTLCTRCHINRVRYNRVHLFLCRILVYVWNMCPIYVACYMIMASYNSTISSSSLSRSVLTAVPVTLQRSSVDLPSHSAVRCLYASPASFVLCVHAISFFGLLPVSSPVLNVYSSFPVVWLMISSRKVRLATLLKNLVCCARRVRIT